MSTTDKPKFDSISPPLSEQAQRAHEEQPAPKPNSLPAVWDLVIKDMIARDKVGHNRYGVRLQPHNGRDVLRDAYEETLDAAVYLRQAIYERDNPVSNVDGNAIRVGLKPDSSAVIIETWVGGKMLAWVEYNAAQLPLLISALNEQGSKLK